VTPEAFQRALRSFSNRRPFVPFEIELVSGDSFAVRHPEAVMIRGNLVLFTQPDRSQRLFDSSSIAQFRDIRV
jgi:hypothetical protein